MEEVEVKYKQQSITPFWRKLPFLFLFPFRLGPAILLGAIVLASAVAGLVLGGIAFAFKGLLAYLGLRYAFNVLELFRKGRFEGESPDHHVWGGAEKRPAKFALVITLFVLLTASLGNFAVGSRLLSDAGAQEQVLASWRQAHSREIAERAAAVAAYERERAQWRAQSAAAAAAAARTEDDPEAAQERTAEPALQEPDPPQAGLSREEMLRDAHPQFGDALWWRLQPAWFWIVVVLASLGLPSAALVIALEDRFFNAINPFNTLHFMQAMGSAYFVLWAFFLGIAGTRQLVLTAGNGLPAALRLPLEMGLATYLALVLFALMGYALYQFHQELHLEVELDFDEHRVAGGAEAIAQVGSARAALAAGQPQDPWERKVQALMAEGNYREAAAEVKDRMRYDRFDAELNLRLHSILMLQGDAAATLAQGQQLLSALARAGLGREALAPVARLTALDAGFRVEDGDAILPIVTAAVKAHDYVLAASLMRNFGSRFPQHKDTPALYFIGARLTSEQNRQHDKAASMLRALLKHFPDHPIRPEVQNYLRVLEAIRT